MTPEALVLEEALSAEQTVLRSLGILIAQRLRVRFDVRAAAAPPHQKPAYVLTASFRESHAPAAVADRLADTIFTRAVVFTRSFPGHQPQPIVYFVLPPTPPRDQHAVRLFDPTSAIALLMTLKYRAGDPSPEFVVQVFCTHERPMPTSIVMP